MRGAFPALAPALLAVALAGCLAPADPALAPAGLDGATDAVAMVAHRAGAFVPVPAELPDLAVRLAPTGYARGEPTIGITASGALFVPGGFALTLPGPAAPPELGFAGILLSRNVGPSVARSTDHGLTWERLYDPAAMGKRDFDPWIWADPVTDRVFHAPLYIACSHLAWSDDEGATWQGSPLGGCGTPAHDHQKLTSGPAPEGVAPGSYPSILYYSYNSFRGEGTLISRSLDGGLTWRDEQVVHPSDACLGGIAGPVAVGADGMAYSPKPTCDGVQVAVSQDGGQSWAAPVRVPGLAAPRHTFYNPDVAVDQAGNAYLVTHGEDGAVWLSTSRDRGATWSAPVQASVPGVRSTVFTNVVAGAEGRIALSYLGTTDDPAAWTSADPSEARDEAVWHAYLASSADALAAEPTFTTQRLTPDEDPVQRGCIWLRGGTEPCRNLRDFADLQQRDGRVYWVYADGCDACTDAAGSRALGQSIVAIQEGGAGLHGMALAPLVPPAAGP